MKKIFFIINLLLSTYSLSQGNLQFNRVVTFTPGSNYTVPTGKVLKIESINITQNTVCLPKTSTNYVTCGTNPTYQVPYGVYSGITYLSIGNIQFSVGSQSGSGSGYMCQGIVNSDCWNYTFSNINISCPIWLETAKTVNIHSGVASILISAIEFNIVP